MNDPAIRLKDLVHLHPGGKGIAGISLDVPRHSLFGFLGPNGAGKSTTIRLLLDFLRPQSGEAVILGLDPWRQGPELRRRIGYLPGEVHLPENLTGREFLAYAARLRGLVFPESRLADLAGALDAATDRRIKHLSKGNKQKIAILHALLFQPDLLILDEPTEGLDPLVQQAFQNLLRQYREAGGTVFMSSHVLSEVERLCDHVAIIRNGRLVEVSPIEDLRTRKARRVELTLTVPADRETMSKALPAARLLRIEGSVVTLEVTGEAGPMLEALARLPVRDIVVEPSRLEDAFMEYYA
ncbi:MAG: ABC transporter ATP-binding protein [Candidatus Sericytochromatia bacterium]|nr:ABC transporter ATP-binding protein [Candidatus Sericytochromatia bacterium]